MWRWLKMPEEDELKMFDATAAHLQHDEFVGTVAIDDPSHLKGLLTRTGIDPEAWYVLGLSVFLIGQGTGVRGDLRFYVVDRSDLAETGNLPGLVDDDGRIPVKEIRVADPDGAIVQEALFPLVKGTVIEVVSSRVRKERWQLRVGDAEED
jgi:hypothetical protein